MIDKFLDPVIQKLENMKRKNLFLVVLLISGILSASAVFFSFSLRIQGEKDKSFIEYPKGESYAEMWEKVKKFENEGQPKSALEVVDQIYEMAKKGENYAQIVKAIIHKQKYTMLIEEDAFMKNVDFLVSEISKAKYPLKPVLQSMLAQTYWGFYQNNRWQYYNRTETVGFDYSDINTWSLEKIIDETIKNYMASLNNADSLKRTRIDVYDDILIQNTYTRKFRPTLYDFLSHRAVDFFMNSESEITRPAASFQLDNPDYFKLGGTFIVQDLKTDDTLSRKFYALKLLQELTKFHMADEDPEALIDVEMKRLGFIWNYSVVPGKDSLYLEALNLLEDKYINEKMSNEVTYLIASYYYTKGMQYKPGGDEKMKDYLKKAYEICEDGIKRNSVGYGADNCRYLQNQIKMKSMYVYNEAYVEPLKSSLASVTYRNIDKLYFRVIKIDKKKHQNEIRNLYNEELVNYFRKLSPVKEWSVSLKNEGDYQTHSTEIKMPELEKGYYLVLASANQDFKYQKNSVSYSYTQSTSLSYVQRKNAESEYDIYVFSRDEGQPLANVDATLWQEKWDYLLQRYKYVKYKTFKTDVNGYFKVEPPVNEYSVNFYLELDNGSDNLISNEYFYQYRPYEYDKNRTNTYFYTDRSIYRPGQTIYFKGIMIDSDGETSSIKANYSTTVLFYDANYQKVAETTLTTNEYGSITGSFTAPQGVLNGQMYLTNGTGSVYFSVEEYKRPKFEVEFLPVQGSYKLEQKVKVKGEAKAYAGSNIDNADVKYTIKRSAYFPYYCWWDSWNYYSFYPYGASETVIANGNTKTDETGTFEIEFEAIPDKTIEKKWKPSFIYTIVADVTDINGETRSSTQTVYVGYTAMTVSTDLTDKISKETVSELELFTNNLSGEHVNAKGTISISKIKPNEKLFVSRLWAAPDYKGFTKDELNKTFPFMVYEDENAVHKRGIEKKVFSAEFDSEKNKKVKLDNIKSWPQGEYLIEIKSKDEFGSAVEYKYYFTVFSENEKTMPVNEIGWFTPVKNKCEPGETAKYLIGSADENVKVIYEVEHKGKIVSKEIITLNKEQKLIEIPVVEKHRGNFSVHFAFVKHSRSFTYSDMISVPYTNKELDITFETFRNKLLPGEKETWKIKIKGKKGEKVAAEMMATLYDASLDAFRSNYWYLNIYPYYYSSMYWSASSAFTFTSGYLIQPEWNDYVYPVSKTYEAMNWFDYYVGYNYYGYEYNRGGRYKDGDADYYLDGGGVSEDAPMRADMEEMDEMEVADKKSAEKSVYPSSAAQTTATGMLAGISDVTTVDSRISAGEATGRNEQANLMPVKARTNFAETAFFYPSLKTNENGEVIIEFTVPEALTKWKMMGMAHTKDLKYGFVQNELVTQKELMVMPNVPRFLRENDKITITSKITNLGENDLNGKAKLLLFDALTMEPIDAKLKNGSNSKDFSVKKGLSVNVAWEIEIPEGIQAVTYRITAQTDKFSDGEENTIPVLTNSMLVTESLPLPIRSKQTKNFTFTKLVNNKSKTLRHHKLTLEFTANPAWYAVQALPYLIEYPYECAEQVFSRFYANSIASHIANSSPKIKKVFDAWRDTPGSKALLSNLEKNQELKSLLLEETPWVLDAQDETERKHRVGLLFDLNHMANNLESAIRKLDKMQAPGGGWCWFDGMPVDRYMTQHIVTGFGHLDHLGVTAIKSDSRIWKMVKGGVNYLDGQIYKDYEYLKRFYSKAEMELMHISYLQVQYLYARSYFMDDLKLPSRYEEAFEYYKGQARKYWLQLNKYSQAQIALALFRFKDEIIPKKIMTSLDEHSLSHEELGMYWKENTLGFYWYEAPIETQALMIEAFDEITGDQKKVDDLKVWLLKQKQTQDWKTTKATTEAVYALLLKGTDWLATESQVEIKLDNQIIDPKKLSDVTVEAGTGYFKTSWMGSDIKQEMGNVTITKKDEGVSWGALYWQYFEQLDKITPHETPLKLNKKLFVERTTLSGSRLEPVEKSDLKIGDKVVVRIELRVDRDMEYVHMKDMRSSGFEPINVISRYKYQDGLGYYESTRDVSTNFFFGLLPKGTYVFEYPLRVTHEGDFSNGITTIQCMYAPEFTSHSEGVRVKVTK